ncbi:uncharacterized protein ARMOST_10163 [Armillaria ostoyae]|uniref:Tyr recombinase domain-containing protein n=1 Tax=Armillaria ostoyae TaxID=47428 RepID=A0A284RDI8_ARMOS|nr:uncharacterized protein ARMOST_10163 [Armillaria ostoyae]
MTTDLTIHNTIVATMKNLTTSLLIRVETEYLTLRHPRTTNHFLIPILSLLFEVAHHHQRPWCAPSVLASMGTSNSAAPQPSGMGELPDAFVPPTDLWSTRAEIRFASTGTDQLDANVHIPAATNAPAVGMHPMEPSTVLMLRKSNSVTPLHPHAWFAHLSAAHLLDRYPTIYNGLAFGFNIGIPPIHTTFTPPNNSSIDLFHSQFDKMVKHEFDADRYIGPFIRKQVEDLIGPFQTSPLSLIPKPHTVDELRLIQNYSFPRSPSFHHSSINYFISSDDFPCTWGTFNVMCFKIALFPPGSQGGIRDVSEAYQNIVTHPSQWPGTVVRLSDTDFVIDPYVTFGETSRCGAYRVVADAGTDIFHAEGSSSHGLQSTMLADLNSTIALLHKVGNINQEDASDCQFPIRDLSNSSPHSSIDVNFTYNFDDVDTISNDLGIPWKHKKDIPFSYVFPFMGLVWNLEARSISLPLQKHEKYITLIQNWLATKVHILSDVESLYGKLLHVCRIIPMGRAYLTNLEKFLAISNNRPFLPRRAQRGTEFDLNWWLSQLLSNPSRPIPGPCAVTDFAAFSDASSGTGIAIVIGDRWHAWRLLPGWKSDERDIQWAEGVGFELLVRAIATQGTYHLYTTNTMWSFDHPKPQTVLNVTSSSMVTVSPLLKAGGMAVTETKKSTSSSDASTMFSHSSTCMSTHDTSQVQLIQPMDPLEEYILPGLSSFHRSLSQKNYSHSSLSSTFRLLPQSSNTEQQLSPSETTPSSIPLTLNQSSTGYHLSIPTTIDPVRAHRSNDIPDRFHPTTQPRPYPVSLAPRPSRLHPHCLARERLIKWRPVLSFSWADKTLETYGSGLLLYHVFCDVRNIPEDARCPASPDIISSFLATMAGNYVSGTLSNYLHGLRAWHILHGLPWLVNEAETTNLITAAVHLQPPRSRKKPRLPYICDTLVSLLHHLDLSLPLDAAVAACLTTMFYSAARLGEFTLTNLGCFDPDTHCKWSNMRKVRDRNNLEQTAFFIPKTKSSAHGEDVFWAMQDGPSDPQALLENHFNDNNPPLTQLIFSYTRNGKLRPLTKSAFLARLHKAFKDAKLEPLQGHGICIGSTLEYLLRGIPFDVVKSIGRWKSDAFVLYLRKHAQILAPYMQAVPAIHEQFIRYTMPQIR